MDAMVIFLAVLGGIVVLIGLTVLAIYGYEQFISIIQTMDYRIKKNKEIRQRKFNDKHNIADNDNDAIE